MINILSVIILIISVVLHEVAHGWMAFRLGDPTAKSQGRLTLNPIPHMDILGSILLPGLLIASGSSFLIGWAKPVPVQPHYFKEPVKGMMLVALVGPLTNFTLMIIASVCLKIFALTFSTIGFGGQIFITICVLTIQINLILGLFNLFPIPPLDGSRILVYYLPRQLQAYMFRMEPYGFVIIFGLVYFGFFTWILRETALPILRVLI